MLNMGAEDATLKKDRTYPRGIPPYEPQPSTNELPKQGPMSSNIPQCCSPCERATQPFRIDGFHGAYYPLGVSNCIIVPCFGRQETKTTSVRRNKFQLERLSLAKWKWMTYYFYSESNLTRVSGFYF